MIFKPLILKRGDPQHDSPEYRESRGVSSFCFFLFPFKTAMATERYTMNERTRLEQAAVAAHARGDDWATFWGQHAADVAAAEPWDLSRRSRLARRLSLLVVAGDLDGDRPAGAGEPWERDDGPQYPASDSETAACVNWTAAGITPVRLTQAWNLLLTESPNTVSLSKNGGFAKTAKTRPNERNG
jgi:hypothetical protein